MPDQHTEDIYAAALKALEEDESSALDMKTDLGSTRLLSQSESDSVQACVAHYQETPYGRQQTFHRTSSKQPENAQAINIVTSDEIAQRKLPMPRLFQNERAVGVNPAYAGEVSYAPIQPRFSTQTIIALICAIAMVFVVVYGSLAMVGKVPLPAFLMYGSSRSAGVTMSSVANFTKAPHYQVDEFSSDKEASQYIDFAEQLLSSTEDLAKSYGELGKEMAKGGVPDLKKIKQLAENADKLTQQTSRELNALVVPDMYSAEGKQYLEKSLKDAKAMVKQGNSTISALYLASSGKLSGFGDAAFSSSNVHRNKEAMFDDLNRAARAIGLKERENK